MTTEKKTIRSDIPGSHLFLNGNTSHVGSAADDLRRLVVARDITLTGNISSCNTLVIEGVVEAEKFSGNRMDILGCGLFSGTAEVRDCVIAGRFEGKLTVRGRLTVKSTGRIAGNVEYGALEVETGAKIEGKMIPVAQPEAHEAASALTVLPSSQSKPEGDVQERKHNIEPLFSDEEDAAGRPAIYRRAARAG